jgi:hypothetical protein
MVEEVVFCSHAIEREGGKPARRSEGIAYFWGAYSAIILFVQRMRQHLHFVH